MATGGISRFVTSAVSGASGGETSVAGALALGIALSDATAEVSDGTMVTVTGAGAATVKAENRLSNDVKSSGRQTDGSGTGVEIIDQAMCFDHRHGTACG